MWPKKKTEAVISFRTATQVGQRPREQKQQKEEQRERGDKRLGLEEGRLEVDGGEEEEWERERDSSYREGKEDRVSEAR